MNSQEQHIRTSLDLKTLLGEACEKSGVPDFTDNNFIEPLTHLLNRAASEVNFSAEGLASYRADLMRILINRLRVEDAINKHPEILQENVEEPIIIIGLPRSGTTKLQRILSTAPDVQKLFMWRMLNPAPFPDAVPEQLDPRMAAAGLDDIMIGENESVGAAHSMSAAQVDEEMILFDFTCDPSVNGFNSYIPLFYHDDWQPGKDRPADLGAYEYMRVLLKYLQWQDGGNSSMPWIMKAIIHIAHLDSLHKYFPKATVVHCHRDPHVAIPSFAKLLWTVWSAKTKHVDKEFVGQHYLNWASISIARYMESRDRLNLNDRILDIKYEDIRNNIDSVVRNIYAKAGRVLSDEAIEAINSWERDNEQGKHGEHHYSLEEFGLNEELINKNFSAYINRFII